MDSTILQPTGNYPDDWIRTDFDHFATLQRGKDLTRDHFRTGSVPVAGSNGIIGYHDTANVKGPGVTVGRSGSVGKVAFYQQDFWAHNTALFVKNFHGNVPAFIAFFLDFSRLGRFGSGASVPTLDRNVFRTLPIVIPPPCEQRKIAVVLGLVQRAIEQQERLIALTAELKKAFLHKLFTEGLRGEPQKQTEIGLVPESWEVTELGKVISLFGGYAFKSEGSVATSDTQLVRMGNLYQNKLDLTRSPIFYPNEFAQKYARFVLKPGDLIMSLTGTSGKEDYGFTVELKSVPKTLLLNQRVARIDLLSAKLTMNFILYFLLSRKFLDQLYPTAKGMKQANLSTHAMKRLKVLVPTVGEQKKIASYFRTIDQKFELHQIKIDTLRELFRSLLHQLMTAQIRVHDLELRTEQI